MTSHSLSLSPSVYDGQLRMARYYAGLVSEANKDYGRGFEASIAAVRRFNLEKMQFERSVEWLIAHLEDDEAANVFVEFLSNSYQLLFARFDRRVFQIWLDHGLAAAQRLGNLSAEAGIYIALGFIAQSAGSYQQSLKLFEKARAIAGEIGNRQNLANSLYALATTLRMVGDMEKTSTLLEQAYQLYRELGNVRGMQSYMSEHGYQQFYAGNFDEALVTLEQTYRLSLQSGDYRETASTLVTTGLIYHMRGQYDLAIGKFEQAQEFAEAIEFPPVLIYVLHATANSYYAVANFDAAQTYFLRALQVANQNSLASNVADIQGDLANVARKQAQYEEALLYVSAALDYHRTTNNAHRISVALSSLSHIHAALGNESAAFSAVRESVEAVCGLENDSWMLTPIGAAIEVFSLFAPHANTQSRLESAALWAGFVSIYPSVDQQIIEVVNTLRPQMEHALTPERTAKLFEQGAALEMDAVIELILAQTRL